MSSDTLITTDQAAVTMGVSVRRVRAICEAGKLGKQVGRNWVLTLAEVQQFMRDNPSREDRKKARLARQAAIAKKIAGKDRRRAKSKSSR